MADVGSKAAYRLGEMTECPICLSAFSDPRMLPCIHTFCFQCLKSTAEEIKLKPGDKMACPLCRSDFVIPEDGLNVIQKNFFMENLVELKTALRMESANTICDMCNIRNEGKTGPIPTATMRCVECQDNYCNSCAKVHQFQKLSRSHQVVNIGIDSRSEVRRASSVKYCARHTQKPLDYYCYECKKIVCVSCFVESHKLHDCKDVSTVDEEFREKIEFKAWKISQYVDEMLTIRTILEKRKIDFMTILTKKEEEILAKSKELKQLIETHTRSLLDELSRIKSNHLKELEIELEELDRNCTILKSFEAYCTEFRSKGSASDICNSLDKLIVRADDLQRDHMAFLGGLRQKVVVSFQATDLGGLSQMDKDNTVGKITAETEHTEQFENSLIVVGLSDGTTISREVRKINLRWPKKGSMQNKVPAAMTIEAFAAVCCNTMYVTGIGDKADEIWKYNMTSGWMKCASLTQGRRRHSAAFVNQVLYICGGFVDSSNTILDSVEAYNVITNKCTITGKLAYSVHGSGNCVPFRNQLYIFGGLDKDNEALNYVQVYNTKQNTCTLLSKRMPCPYSLMRAALWEKSVILLGRFTCLIFNFETETWLERKRFKTNVTHFGLVVENERLFVLGGGNSEIVVDGKTKWTCRNDIHSLSIQDILNEKPCSWRFHGRLPIPSMIHVCEKLTAFLP